MPTKKGGSKRRELEVSSCFAPLLRWVLRLWQSEQRQLALVMDATTLGNRWTILAISVVVWSCAISVAWKVLPAEQEGSWRPPYTGRFLLEVRLSSPVILSAARESVDLARNDIERRF